jgi:hypothetical protein
VYPRLSGLLSKADCKKYMNLKEMLDEYNDHLFDADLQQKINTIGLTIPERAIRFVTKDGELI